MCFMCTLMAFFRLWQKIKFLFIYFLKINAVNRLQQKPLFTVLAIEYQNCNTFSLSLEDLKIVIWWSVVR